MYCLCCLLDSLLLYNCDHYTDSFWIGEMSYKWRKRMRRVKCVFSVCACVDEEFVYVWFAFTLLCSAHLNKYFNHTSLLKPTIMIRFMSVSKTITGLLITPVCGFTSNSVNCWLVGSVSETLCWINVGSFSSYKI